MTTGVEPVQSLEVLAEQSRCLALVAVRGEAKDRATFGVTAPYSLETTAADTKLSTIERYADALGYSIVY